MNYIVGESYDFLVTGLGERRIKLKDRQGYARPESMKYEPTPAQDNDGDGLPDDVFTLSCKYGQDCFLYKEQGQQAVLVGTNVDFGMRKRIELGDLHINNTTHPHNSEVGIGRFSFG